ncbi:MAG: GNAT family N-acetyltransferase [Actinomycetota bacterium]|nr:GNAT family N-acetyltransferase [Actinomycetota bacterium]
MAELRAGEDRSGIRLAVGHDLDLDDVIDVYRDSTIGQRRPVDDRERMAAMLANANLVVTAWYGNTLVGIARSLSDFSYATYLSDLAVRRSYQRRGIGRMLIARTQHEGGSARITLLAAPAAADYYPRIGMRRHDSAWCLSPDEELTAQ